jgi:predicted metal-binding protein
MQNTLLQLAQNEEVYRAAWLEPKELQIKPQLRKKCQTCPSYGTSPNCPPLAITPQEFCQILQNYKAVLVFCYKSSQFNWQELSRKVNYTVGKLRQAAGQVNSFGLAVGGCKQLFCAEKEKCPVLMGKRCPFANIVQTSFSAVGIDFNKLAHKLGWKLDPQKYALLTGLVLI